MSEISQAPPASIDSGRVDWLDGLRGAAALFVVLHHCWLAVWPAFPRDTGPASLSWLLYGHLAVAVFIVVSGFSLALAPMRRGGELSRGIGDFLRRRAWRILPPYWAALVFSVVAAGFLVQPRIGAHALARSFVVHGLLLQDITGSAPPNGAFWSIAVEWQIYFLFPLILWLGRRISFTGVVTGTVALVVLAHVVAGMGSPYNKIGHVTPQFLALFALGVLGASTGRARHGARFRWVVGLIGVALLGAVLAMALVNGSVWVVDRYFWIDLIFGAGVACVMTLMYFGGARRLRRLLASRAGRRLGLFSYSIYLLHAPLVGTLDQYAFGPLHVAPALTFALLVGLGVPVILLLCYAFHLVFEAPFLHRRDAAALRDIPVLGGLLSSRRPVPNPSPPALTPPAVAAATRSDAP